MLAIMVANVLANERGHVPKAEVLTKIPTAKEAAGWIGSMCNGAWNVFASPLLMSALVRALVCESLIQYDLALSHMATLLELLHNRGGDVKPFSHTRGNCVRGRAGRAGVVSGGGSSI